MRHIILLPLALLLMASCRQAAPSGEAAEAAATTSETAADGSGSTSTTTAAGDDTEGYATALAEAIASTNEQLPLDLGQGLVIDHVELSGDNVTFVCLIDELQGSSVASVMDNATALREMLVESLAQTPASERQLMRAAVNCGKNYCYSYRNTLGTERFDILISTAELLAAL